MANVSLLWSKASDACTLSQGSWSASLPLTNMQSADIMAVARSTSAATSSTKFRLDGGTTPTQTWSQFAVLAHNASKSATIEFVLTNDATDTNPAQRQHTTGPLQMWVPTLVFGAQPWGSFPWGGVDDAAYPAGPTFFHLLNAPVVARYLWVYVTDTANPAGYVQIGRFLAGQAWSPTRNVSYGLSIGWVDPAPVRRAPKGRRFAGAGFTRYRRVEMEFPVLTEAEAFGIAFEIGRQIGKTGDVFFVANSDDDPSVRFRRSAYCALPDVNAIVQPRFSGLSWRLQLEEIV